MKKDFWIIFNLKQAKFFQTVQLLGRQVSESGISILGSTYIFCKAKFIETHHHFHVGQNLFWTDECMPTKINLGSPNFGSYRQCVYAHKIKSCLNVCCYTRGLLPKLYKKSSRQVARRLHAEWHLGATYQSLADLNPGLLTLLAQFHYPGPCHFPEIA